MRLLITFLITLFLPSLVGNKAVFGSIVTIEHRQSVIQEIVLSKVFNQSLEKRDIVVADPRGTLNPEDEPVLAEDSRDDEPVRKSKLLLATLSVFIYPFLVNQSHCEEISPQYFSEDSPAVITAKYISQRVLRI